MNSLSEMVSEAFSRDYNLASTGYVKNRRRVYVHEYENVPKVAAVYRWMRRKYKSAWFELHEPPRKMMMDLCMATNPLLKKLYGVTNLHKGES